MRFFGRIGSTLALLAVAATGHAAVLTTAPARAGYPSFSGRTMYCDIRYVGNGEGTVTIEILAYSGTALATYGPVTVGSFAGTAYSDGGSGNGTSCKFTVSGSARKWRGVAVYDNGTDYTIAIPAQ